MVKNGSKARHKLAIGLCLMLAACGTSYEMPVTGAADEAAARQALAQGETAAGPTLSPAAAMATFRRATARTEPAAEAFCRQRIDPSRRATCDVEIRIDPRDSDQPNAYQTYEDGRPVIAFNKAFINDMRNEDEVAFVIGHEMGHHMAAHIDKRQGQAVAGALIVGALAGIAGNAIDPDMSDQAMRRTIGAGMAVGALGGSRAYSQTYELEADTIGVYIALAAGYDPERGARIFARGAAARNPDGSLNFLATHPPSARRLAQVSATTTAARAGRTN
jgi:Zn-dependent protease with chaperone function